VNVNLNVNVDVVAVLSYVDVIMLITSSWITAIYVFSFDKVPGMM